MGLSAGVEGAESPGEELNGGTVDSKGGEVPADSVAQVLCFRPRKGIEKLGSK